MDPTTSAPATRYVVRWLGPGSRGFNVNRSCGPWWRWTRTEVVASPEAAVAAVAAPMRAGERVAEAVAETDTGPLRYTTQRLARRARGRTGNVINKKIEE